MSETLRHYLGGQIALMPELTALYWPTINSYKRSVENTWAPTTATWGRENRTCAMRRHRRLAQVDAGRVPAARRGHEPVHRDGGLARGGAVGHRAPRSSRRRRATGNGYAGRGAAPLPRNLQATRSSCSRRSERARELLGEGFVDHFVRTREWEVRQFERAVTTWELERYLELI